MQNTLKLLCWNVHYLTFAEDNTYVIDTIENLGPFDVICLQEYVDGKDSELQKWFDQNNYETAYLPFAHNLEGASMGVMTAVRKNLHSITKPKTLRSDTPRKFRPFPNIRGVLETTIKLQDKNLEILNFHATYPMPHVIDMRKREFKSLKDLLNSNDSKNPWVLCGDFNFFARDKRRKYLTKNYKFYTGSKSGKTWRHKSSYIPLNANLDYIFWNGEDLQVTAKTESFNKSDHRPLTASIKL